MDDKSQVIEAYRQPETKIILKSMTDPRPHKIASAYLKAKVRLLLGRSHEKKALWTRPIDDMSFLAVDALQGGGALGGSQLGRRVAAMVAPRSMQMQAVGMIGGALAGSSLAGAVGKKIIGGAINAADQAGVLPEALTHVNIMSERQSKYSNIGSAAGIAMAVPLSLRLLLKPGTSPIAAVAGSLGSAYLLSRAGNAAGNVAGYYADKRSDVIGDTASDPDA